MIYAISEENFEAKLNRKSQILTVTTIAASILLVVLLSFAIHFRRKRKELIRAKAELEQTNRRLDATLQDDGGRHGE